MNHQPNTPASVNEAVAGLLPSSEGAVALPDRIMKIPAAPPKGANINQRVSYRVGHRDALRAAAELALAAPGAAIDAREQPTPTPQQISDYLNGLDVIRRAVAQPVTMTPMEFDDGRKGWYVQNADFYLDIEQDANGKWSAFFRHTYGGEAFADQADAAQPCTSQGCAVEAALGKQVWFDRKDVRRIIAALSKNN